MYVKKDFDNFKNWLNSDFYHILGVNQSASSEQINKAFKAMVKKINPYQFPEASHARLEAEESLKLLIKAKEVLNDSKARELYDRERQILQDCYLSYIRTKDQLSSEKVIISVENPFEKPKKAVKSSIKSKPGIKLDRLKKYISKETENSNIYLNQAEEISDIFYLYMTERQFN